MQLIIKFLLGYSMEIVIWWGKGRVCRRGGSKFSTSGDSPIPPVFVQSLGNQTVGFEPGIF